MKIESNELKLNNTENKLLAEVMLGLVEDFYKDEKNVAAFEKEKESLKKEVKSLEVKRIAAKKKQKREAVSD
ncbi:MAG: hypothetical protein IKB98_04665 [Clostridia bacterium]|nr:hypothetical protein [Clostridia bacterium]